MPVLQTRDLLQRATVLVGDWLREGSAFNPASLLLRREVDLSRVIAWMLDPLGNHREGGAFLSRFLEAVGITNIVDVNLARVRLEVPRFANHEPVGRVDIEVSHPRFLLLIENKPTAALGFMQLERYTSSLLADRVRRGAVVMLPGSGWTEDELQRITRLGVIVLRLGDEVQKWIVDCREIARTPVVKLFLDGLQQDLEERYAGRGSKYMRELVDLMLETPDALAAAVAVMNAREALSDQMTRRFASMVAERSDADKTGLVCTHEKESLFSPRPFGTLRLDIGDVRFDFTIHASDKNFQRVRVGLCVRTETEALGRVYESEIARLSKLMGAGDRGEKLDGWWLWWEDVAALDIRGGQSGSNPALWKWAADQSNDGLAACFVRRAEDAKRALTQK